MTDLQKVISAFAAWTLAIVVFVIFGLEAPATMAIPLVIAGLVAFICGVL